MSESVLLCCWFPSLLSVSFRFLVVCSSSFCSVCFVLFCVGLFHDSVTSLFLSVWATVIPANHFHITKFHLFSSGNGWLFFYLLTSKKMQNKKRWAILYIHRYVFSLTGGLRKVELSVSLDQQAVLCLAVCLCTLCIISYVVWTQDKEGPVTCIVKSLIFRSKWENVQF